MLILFEGRELIMSDINQTDADGLNAENVRRGREHWQKVVLMLAFYDAFAVNFAYLIALWLRFDCRFTAIRPGFLRAWLYFVPLYPGLSILVLQRSGVQPYLPSSHPPFIQFSSLCFLSECLFLII